MSKRVSKKRVIVSKVNRAKHLSWCREKRRCKVEDEWDRLIFSDESQVVIGSDNRVLILSSLARRKVV
jgi:hypothetical protein